MVIQEHSPCNWQETTVLSKAVLEYGMFSLIYSSCLAACTVFVFTLLLNLLHDLMMAIYFYYIVSSALTPWIDYLQRISSQTDY